MKKYILILIAAMALCACSKSDFKGTQYIDDPDYPGLPIYSEMGYNTFGAYINQKAFSCSGSADRPFYIVADREKLTLTLYGWYNYNDNFNIEFTLPIDTSYQLGDFNSLDILDGKTFTIDTTSTTCNVKFTGSYAPVIESIYSGHITFEKVQQVIVDKTEVELVVAGKFQFRAFTHDGNRIDVSGGRFDLGVDNSNFVNYRN